MKDSYLFLLAAFLIIVLAPGFALAQIDFSIWELQEPSGSGTSPTIITPADLVAGYSDSYFYTAGDGGQVFMDTATGITTSGSVHPRCEMREMSGGAGAAWAPTGTNTETVTGQVLLLGDGSSGHTTIAQVFNSTLDIPLCEFQYVGSVGGFEILYEEAKGAGSMINLNTACALNTKYTFELSLSNNLLTVSINGTAVYTHTPSASILTDQFYFKCGNYDQTAVAGAVTTTPYTEVEDYLIDVFHGSGTPTSSPTGTATFTFTATASNTTTRTFSPTATNTSTNTPFLTNTASSTATRTFTATASNTQTNTSVNSSTPVNTSSNTPTYTGTATMTDTGTLPPTDTFTMTLTNTAAFTSTSTATFTSTFTGTFTNTATKTFTNTATLTSVDTSTNTATFTNTPTNSLTSTFTYTNTMTPSLTPTLTPTQTPNATDTTTPVNTYTRTWTPTSTCILTPTPALTNCPGVPAWNGHETVYETGQEAGYNGELYQCIQTHTSGPGLTPPSQPTLWKALGSCGTTPTQTGTGSPVVYPNPCTGSSTTVELPMSNATNVKVEIFTVAFREVQKVTTTQVMGNSLTIPLIDKTGVQLANGLYYFVIQTNSQKWTTKVLVLR